MSRLKLFDPLLNDEVEDMVRGLFHPVRLPKLPAAPRVKLEVTEDDRQFVVKAEMPGIARDDIDVLELTLPKRPGSEPRRIAIQ